MRESVKTVRPEANGKLLEGGKSSKREMWHLGLTALLAKPNQQYTNVDSRCSKQGLSVPLKDAVNNIMPRGEDGLLKLVRHWAERGDWLIAGWLIQLWAVFHTSTWLDWTPTVSRVAATVGVDVEVTGVGLIHRRRGFYPNITARGIPPRHQDWQHVMFKNKWLPVLADWS